MVNEICLSVQKHVDILSACPGREAEGDILCAEEAIRNANLSVSVSPPRGETPQLAQRQSGIEAGYWWVSDTISWRSGSTSHQWRRWDVTEQSPNVKDPLRFPNPPANQAGTCSMPLPGGTRLCTPPGKGGHQHTPSSARGPLLSPPPWERGVLQLWAHPWMATPARNAPRTPEGSLLRAPSSHPGWLQPIMRMLHQPLTKVLALAGQVLVLSALI